MQFQPSASDYAAVPHMSDEELLEYFLFRIFENDEVWLLKQDRRYFSRALDEHETLPVWPYKRYADDAALDIWQDCRPVGESLEYFMRDLLEQAKGLNQLIEIMPRQTAAGCLISPQRLFNFLDRLKDSREFVLDDY